MPKFNKQMRGKTIQIYLPTGSPTGIKVASITNNIEQAIFIPRTQIQDASKRYDTHRPGIYFLFGEEEDKLKPTVYIGKTTDGIARIKQHDFGKDWWTDAVLIVSKIENFNEGHVSFLEALAIEMAINSDRYNLANDKNPPKRKIQEHLEADLLDNFDIINILLSTLGFPLYEPVRQHINAITGVTNLIDQNTNTNVQIDPLGDLKLTSPNSLLYCKGKDVKATGENTDIGFRVFADSTVVGELTPSAGKWISDLRGRLIADKILLPNENGYFFNENYVFKSPTAASSVVLGRSTNGRTEWKNDKGITLAVLEAPNIPTAPQS